MSLQIQPNQQLSLVKQKTKNLTGELDVGFINILFASQQSENEPLNLEGFLNQVLKKDTLTSPSFKKLIQQVPDKVLSEFKKLMGNSIEKILADNTVSPEAKTLSFIVATLQLKEVKTQNTLLKTTINTEAKVSNAKNKRTFEPKNIGELSSRPDILEQKKEQTNLNTNFIIKPNIKKLTNEHNSYGEFKLERQNVPTIQVNLTDAPEQSQKNFMKQLETILNSSRFSRIAKNHSQMTIQLKPHNLGFMTIKIEQVHQDLVARIITSSTPTKELIESNIHQLKHLNVQVDKFEVDIQHQDNQPLRDEEQSKKQGNQQKNGQHKDEEHSSQSFEEQLANILPQEAQI